MPLGQAAVSTYIKIANDETLQDSNVFTCPDGKWLAGQYIKCFTSDSAYTAQCTGSNYCGDHTIWSATMNRCIGSTMQTFSKNDCDSYPTPSGTGYTTVGRLTDARDNKTYLIRKYADGHCWMAQDLAFGACFAETSAGLAQYKAGASVSTQDKIASGYYGVCMIATASNAYLYNWQAAVQNSNAYQGNNYQPSVPNQGICPTGWHVPSGGDSGETMALARAVNGGAALTDVNSSGYHQVDGALWQFWKSGGSWNGTFAGTAYRDGTQIGYQGTSSSYWTTTQTNSAAAYRIDAYIPLKIVYPSFVEPAKGNGCAVRCVRDY